MIDQTKDLTEEYRRAFVETVDAGDMHGAMYVLGSWIGWILDTGEGAA